MPSEANTTLRSVIITTTTTLRPPVMSEETEDQLFHIFFYISVPIAIFGTLANVANIVVFYRMGFSVTSNISLFALAISDLICVFNILVIWLVHHPAFYYEEFYMRLTDIVILMIPIFHCSSAFGSWVTAIINVERSCCVVIPMKVKTIFTRKTIFWLLIAMLFYQISGVPHYWGRGISVTISERTNRTLYYLDPEKFDDKLVAIPIVVSYSVPTITCFVVVIIGTTFLVIKFRQSTQMRKKMSGKSIDEKSTKDARVTRSVIIICVFYIFGYIPSVITFLGSAVEPKMHMYDPYYGSLFVFFISVGYLTQVIAGSANIFVYWQMSSKFKETFIGLFKC